MTAHLQIDDLRAGYGGFAVLRGLSLDVRPGLTVILGPNGAGKSTLLKAIAGLIPRGGRVLLDGAEIAPSATTADLVGRGLALVAEGRQLFPQMSVAENLELGGWLLTKAERARRLAVIWADFPKLAERAAQLAGTMSGGEQQMVAVARALMSAPKLLLLDEPSLGLAPKMVAELLALARRIADAGTTVLMVEQNVRRALAVADRGHVLERGRFVAAGAAVLLARSSVVARAYLGSTQENTVSDLSMLIDGLSVTAERGATFECRNPFDGSVATRAPAASVADVLLAADAAALAFESWCRTSPGVRGALLSKAAAALEARTAQFTAAMAAETGATALWAGFNVHLAADMLRQAAALTTQASGQPTPPDVPGSLAVAVRQPAGVVLAIAPWKAPVIDAVRAVAAALACGDTVVLKGSENCPRTHGLVALALAEAGFPAGVVNHVTNAPEDAGALVDAIVAHPAVRRVHFTGSTRVGELIAMTCARQLEPVLLELGGKAPLVVPDDADLDAAVDAAAFGACVRPGPSCMSTERIVVDARVADELVARLAQKAVSLPLGDQTVVLESVIGPALVEHCNALIDDALAKGAKLVCGGRSTSTSMPATLLDHVTPAMRIYREESFGPVKAIVRVDGVEAAIACASASDNDNDHGPAAAVFGRDTARALAVARRIESGLCPVDGAAVHDGAQVPFGGVEGPGLNRYGGQPGTAGFADLRPITARSGPRHDPS